MCRHAPTLALAILVLVTPPAFPGGFLPRSGYETLLELPFGSAAGNLPGPQRGAIAQGIANSFQRTEKGFQLLVPDLRQLLTFDGEGRFLRAIVPLEGERPLPATVMLVDFDCDAAGRFYLLERGSGSVLQLSPAGRILNRFGTFVHGEELAINGNRIAVRDGATGTISVFSLSGRLLWQRKGWIWSVHLPRGSSFYGIRHRNRIARIMKAPASLYKVGKGTRPMTASRSRIFASLRPVGKGHDFFGARIIGVEASGTLDVLTIEGAGSSAEISYLHRFDEDGKILDRQPVPLWWQMSQELPRELRVTPTGEILGMQWDAHKYEIVRVRRTQNAPPSPPEAQ